MKADYRDGIHGIAGESPSEVFVMDFSESAESISKMPTQGSFRSRRREVCDETVYRAVQYNHTRHCHHII
jgi:hypothetical protein